MLRWKKINPSKLQAFDKWTSTYYTASELNDGRWHLGIVVDNCDDTYGQDFKTLGALKAWVTKNFG